MYINKYNNDYRTKGFIIILTIIFLLASGLFIYNKKIQENLSSTVCVTLEEIMKQQKFNFYNKIISNDKAIRSFALLINDENDDDSKIIENLKFIKKNSSFDYVTLIKNDDVCISTLGQYSAIPEREYLNKTRAGETIVSQFITSVDSELPTKFILFATPIFNSKDEIIGTLVGGYNSEQLDTLFLSSFSDKGFAYVTDSMGNLIARTPNISDSTFSGNFFEILRESEFYEYDDFPSILKKIANNDHGHSKYIYQGKKYFVHYTSIGLNNWKLFSIAPEQVFLETSNNIFINALFLTILLVIIVGGQGLYVYKVQQLHIKELYITAFIDELTGASNFKKFKIDAVKLLSDNTDSETNYTIIKLDVDRFKLINTIYGYEIGDKILKIISATLKRILDPQIDTFSRLNSDEFLILINYKDPAELNVKREFFEKIVAEQVNTLVDFKMMIPEGRYDIPKTETNITTIFEKANFAHHMAKHSDTKTCYYNDDIKAVAIKEKEMENRMEEALLHGEFHMFVQPKYRLTDETIIGAEVLARWKVDENTFISPAIFIPLFEQNGFITKLDFFMFEETCKNLRKWIDAGIKPVAISVNFSRLHLANKNFVEQLADLADQYSLPHDLLEIEITETAIFDNIKILSAVLEKLHQHGFTLSMDDFGSGYSSLGLLKNLSVDVIKIDRGFFDESTNISREKAVIAGVITMAQNLNIITVAEGVETKLHIDLLKELKCDIVQGFYYSKPLPLAEFEKKIQENRN